MRNFWTLVGFEYKKIGKRKSAVFTLLAVLAVLCASPLFIFTGYAYIDGQPFESHYEAMVKDRAYERALTGRAMDESLMAEAQAAYAKIPDVERYGTTPEYQQYARPYSQILRMMDSVYDLDREALQALTREEMQNYYTIRHEHVAAEIRAMNISPAAKDTLIQLDSRIDTPFILAYSGGYDTFAGMVYTIGGIGAFALAICLAPLFAGEYSARTDPLILSSKWGKTRLVSAKLFTAFSLCAAFFLLLVGLSFLSCMAVRGYGGAGAPLQLLFMARSIYPLTIGAAMLIFIACTFCGTLLAVSVTLWLSSRLKSPFGVIIVISLLLFAPMMVEVSETMVWLYNLFSLLPTNMASLWRVFSPVPFEVFGVTVLPCVFLPAFAVTVSLVLLPFTRRGFRNH